MRQTIIFRVILFSIITYLGYTTQNNTKQKKGEVVRYHKEASRVRRGAVPSLCQVQTDIVCSGSLLSPTTAISANYCYPRQEYRMWVYAGNVNYTRISALDADAQKKRISHFQWPSEPIMLVFVEGRFHQTPTVNWAVLPSEDRVPDGWNNTCEFYGFGKGSPGYETENQVCAVSRVQCRDDRGAGLRCGEEQEPHMACPGDVGGPLMCTGDDGTQRLMGVAIPWKDSKGSCSSVVKFLYAGLYREWIKKTVPDFPDLKQNKKVIYRKETSVAERGASTSVCMLRTDVVCTCSLLSPSAVLTAARPCLPPGSTTRYCQYHKQQASRRPV